MNCPICRSVKISKKNHIRYRNLSICRQCGVVFVYPQPHKKSIAQLYNSSYFKNDRSHLCGYENYGKDRKLIIKTAHRRLEFIEKNCQLRGKLLDIGCSMGFFLKVAEDRGWKVRGIDISEDAITIAQEDLMGKVRATTLEESSFPNNHFDLITLWDTLEHVPDPVQTISQCYRILKPGGCLILTVPNISSWPAKIMGTNWMGYKDEHLFYFTRRSLKILLTQAGFEVKKIRYTGKYINLNMFTKRLSLYSVPIATIIQKLINLLRLNTHSIYINPLDIVMIISQKQIRTSNHLQ